MKPVAMLYATPEGQTRRIAEYIATGLRARGLEADARNLADETEIDLNKYAAVLIAGSVHAGRHEPELVRFVKQHLDELRSLPTTFLSVTLSEAGVERATAKAEERARFTAEVQKVIDNFCNETDWRPARIKPVAGALLYTKYNFFVRFIMKRIARKAGAETDTSRDYEYTDWRGLDGFMDALCKEMLAPETMRNVS